MGTPVRFRDMRLKSLMYGECSVCKILLGKSWSTFAQENNLGICRAFHIVDFRVQVETRQATGAHLLCCPKESSPAFLLHDFLGARVPGGVQVPVHLYLLGIWVSPGVFRVRLTCLSTEEFFVGSRHL